MEDTLHCEQCGAPLPDRPQEIGCVHCLLRAGMEPDVQEAVSSPADFGTQFFQHYRILLHEDGAPWELGRGAMGVTFKAVDINLQVPVALKVLNGRFSTLPDAHERFLQEAQAAAQLRHPNVASVFHFGVVNVLPGSVAGDRTHENGAENARGDCFYAMEFVEGETLEARLRRLGPLSPMLAVEIGLQVARALAAAEKCGLVHRDLKPANIMLLAPEESRGEAFPPADASEIWVKVIDFGLAQAATNENGDDATKSSRFLGTPAFASPEQLQGQPLDIRSDIFSLGCVLWYALTGRVPFPPQDRHDLLTAGSPRVLPLHQLAERGVSRRLVSLLGSMLARAPADRPASGPELVEALRGCRLIDSLPSPPASTRKRIIILASAFAAVVAAVVGVAVSGWNAGALPDDKSIAVLPFTNLSTNRNDEFFAEGLEDDLVASLVKIRDLKVVGRRSAADYPPRGARDLPAIGHALGVSHILEGSLRRSGDRVVLQASLLDTRTGKVLWAERYDRSLDDAVSLQGELAAAIVDALDATLTPQEMTDIHVKPTHSADAYLLYLRGLKLEHGPIFAISDYEAARSVYLQALALDPNFALAHARLSSTLGLLYRFRGPTEALRSDAFAEARTSLRLQPNLGEAHLAKALCYYRIERNFSAALPELQIAHHLLPNDPEPLSFISYIQRREGKWRQARADMEQVATVAPLNFPDVEELYATSCLLRDWSEADRWSRRLHVLAADVPQVNAETAYLPLWWKGDLVPLQTVFARYTEYGDPEGDVTWARWDSAMLARDYPKARAALNRFPYQTLPSVFAAPLPKSYLAGCIELAQGHRDLALKEFEIARPAMEAEALAHVDDALRHARLGLLYAYMGRKAAAIQEGERAVQLQPVSADAYDGPQRLCTLALIHARVGDNEIAISMIQSLLRRPGCVSFYEASLSLNDLRLRWQWDPLRSDPRFQKILQGPEPRTVY